jgi:predicted nuclease with RNAse H fold
MDFEIDLNDAEVFQMAVEAAELARKEDEIEIQRNAAVSGFKAQLQDIQSNIKQLLRCVDVKKRRVKGECEVIYDYAERMVRFRSVDYGITVLERTMSLEEAQMPLFGEEGQDADSD